MSLLEVSGLRKVYTTRFGGNSVEALKNGAGVQGLIKMPVREQIGRYKYTLEENLDTEYQKILDTLDAQIADVCGKEDF